MALIGNQKATSENLTNKELTGVELTSSVSGTAVKDEDNMTSNSSTAICTQQSIKTYVDNKVKIQLIRDSKPNNVQGGTFTSGAWVIRDLTQTQGDSLATLSSNQFTLPPGKYIIEWSAPAYSVNRHASRLYAVTGAVVDQSGSSEMSSTLDGITTISVGSYATTLGGSTTFRIEHRCQTTTAVNGLGQSIGSTFAVTNEIYTKVK